MPELFSKIDSVHKIPGDGNCQFRALSHALHGTDVYHKDVRRCTVSELEKNWDSYKDFVDSPDTYIENMSRTGTFGDNVTLKAFCSAYNHGVAVIDKGGSVSTLRPPVTHMDPRDYITVVYVPSMQHYNAIDPYNVHPTRALLNRMGNNASLKIKINQV